EKIVQRSAGEVELRLGKLLESASEADEHQIGFVAEHLDEGGRSGIRYDQRTDGLLRHPLAIGGRQPADAIPPHPVHQVQNAPAFERFRNERVVHQEMVNPKSQIPNPNPNVPYSGSARSSSIDGRISSAGPSSDRSTRDE